MTLSPNGQMNNQYEYHICFTKKKGGGKGNQENLFERIDLRDFSDFQMRSDPTLGINSWLKVNEAI